MASSRVGAMTSASGAPAGANRSSAPSSVSAKARPKATVLPEPVWAETSRSRPAASACSTAACTGGGRGIAAFAQRTGECRMGGGETRAGGMLAYGVQLMSIRKNASLAVGCHLTSLRAANIITSW